MTAVIASPVPVALGSVTADTEEGRAFLQERLGLYAMWVFILSAGFYLLNTILTADLRANLTPYSLAHLAATVTGGVVWAATRTVQLRASALQWMDASVLIGICALFAFMGGGMAQLHVAIGMDTMHALLVGQLAAGSTVIFRAVAVPSTARRTFWITLVALTPHCVVSAYVLLSAPVAVPFPGFDSPAQLAAANALNIAGWCGVALAVSTVGSRIIFGLRAEADKVKRLGQYALERKIGEGGMGMVFRARHAMLRRPTAIKLLSPEKAGEDSVRRFEREVQLTATLSHPSTVAIFDYGRTPDGLFYYAMEYLDGLDLQALVREDGPQSPARVIHILEQVGGALTEAHEVGLIHRDIKPANIILCERGGMPDVAKVVDFGLVKPVVSSSSDLTVAMTGRRVLTGTPQYMAPEVIRGEATVDGRSDLYALGAVGYFLVSGTPLYATDNVVELLAAHLHTPPVPPSQRAAQPVPPDLEDLILRCLAKDPAQRFGSARELTLALHACATAHPWSLQEAATWWNAFRQRSRAASPDGGAHDLAGTLAVDVAGRS